jgi:hypothetical protein
MALIDPDEFARGRALAVADWKKRGEPLIAKAFEALALERCGFGLTQTARTCWAVVNGLRIGLAFAIESGEYERSWVERPPAAPPPAPGKPPTS